MKVSSELVAVIEQRLRIVRARMARSCDRVGRPVESVRLVAVTKRQSLDAVAAAISLGLQDVAENYAQELISKAGGWANLASPPPPTWHAIGYLQRNKVARLMPWVDWIDSVDRVALVEALAAGAAQRHDRPLRCLVQVNISNEPQKSGCTEAALPAILDAFSCTQGALVCCGLMGIPPAGTHPEQSRPFFRRLRELRDRYALAAHPHVELTELSMGMSHDFDIAIEEGATQIRVGTALFGAR